MEQKLRYGTFGLVAFFARPGAPTASLAASARTKIVVVVPHRVLFTVAVPVYIAHEKGFYRGNTISTLTPCLPGAGAKTCKRWSPATRRLVSAPELWRSLAHS